jgi:hypothetical protein
MDHAWGARTQLFLREEAAALGPAIAELLGRALPHEFRGLPVDLVQPGGVGSFLMTRTSEGPVRHAVRVTTVARFCRGHLGVDPRGGMSVEDWLVVPQQRLLGLTAGRVFHDGLGELEPLRTTLRYYPEDIWLALLAAQWRRVDQEEPFMARCADVGDEIGSRVVAARQVRELMRLCFLIERRYWPYTKWFGTAFARLPCAELVGPHLSAALAGESWPERERALSAAYSAVAELHNGLGIGEPLETAVSPFHDRPYLVIHSDRFVEALRARIVDPLLREVATTGCVDQFADSTDVLSYPERYERLRSFFRTPGRGASPSGP